MDRRGGLAFPAGPWREGTGNSYKLDLCVIFSGATGTTRVLQMYSANKITGPGQRVPRRDHAGAQTVGNDYRDRLCIFLLFWFLSSMQPLW